MGLCTTPGKALPARPTRRRHLQETATLVLGWIRQHRLRADVAGPRESKRPGIYRATYELLELVAAESCKEKGIADSADETMRPAENGAA